MVTLTKKDYCDYETCVALERLGFNDSTDLRYNHSQILGDFLGGVKAPTLYEAQKWLREEKKIDVLIEIECKDVHLSSKHYSVFISYMGRFMRRFQYLSNEFDSYEEALSEGIKEAVKILKENETIHE